VRSIRSAGGPLLVIPEPALPSWSGAFGPDGDDDWPEEETDYWRVSEEVTDYAGIVEVGGYQALTLANGSSPMTFLEPERLFLQRLAIGGEPDVVATVRRILPTVSWQYFLEWEVNAQCVVIDSARYGPALRPDDCLPINLPVGRYVVRSAYHKPTPQADVFVALTQLEPAY
jgi:hypothetical protein